MGLHTAEVPSRKGKPGQAACTGSAGSYIERSNIKAHRPTALINITVDGERVVLDGSGSQPAEEGGPVLIDYLWSARPGNPAPLIVQGIGRMEDREMTGEVSDRTISVLPPAVDGEYYVRLRVKDQAGREDTSTSYFVVGTGRRAPDYDRETRLGGSAVVYGGSSGTWFKAVLTISDTAAWRMPCGWRYQQISSRRLAMPSWITLN
jgi:hypothetical protein